MSLRRLARAPALALAPTVVALLSGLFFLATLRDGHRWGDDFAMYIHHAINIADGAPYADTGYLYNPHNPVVGPRTYPPLFPLILVPVYRIFGLDFQPMKMVIVAFWVGSLLLLQPLFRGRLGRGEMTALTLLFGFNPASWEMKDSVSSDIPFLFFFLLSLVQMRRLFEARESRAVLAEVTTGAAFWLSFATRTVGIVLGPILLTWDLMAHRRPTRRAVVAVAAFLALVAIQVGFLGTDTSYRDQLIVTPASVAANVVGYMWNATTVFGLEESDMAGKAFLIAMAALAAVGFAGQWRARRLEGLDLAPVWYLLPVALWPSRQGLRFLMPSAPFFIAWALMGLRELRPAGASRAPDRPAARPLIALTLALAAVYAARYARTDFGPMADGVARPESVAMFEFVKASTRPDDVVVFSKPRALSLMTGRPASAPFAPDDDRDLWRYLSDIHARWLVIGPDLLGPHEAWLREFAARHRDALVPAFANAQFTVLRVERYPG